MEKIPLEHFLILAAALFSIGLIIVITKKNVIMVLMGIELLLNAANINFIAFSRYDPVYLRGQVFSVFIIVIAAAEAAIALAIIMKVFARFRSLDLNDINRLKG
jgi:NADH:ubiquinone oxidoreductase subunit K